MARSAIESDFRSSKMAAGSHFVKRNSKKKVVYWSEMVQIGLPKWLPAAILKKKNQKQKLRIDLKWREMHSKVIFGHPKWPPAAILRKKIKVAYWSETARNAIKSDFRSSKMAVGSHFVKTKVAYWSEKSMTRNAIESDFRSSKMVAGSHFEKKNQKQKLRIDLKWREMHSKVIFGHPKWPPAAILRKKIKVAYWSETARNAIKSDFRSSKMAVGSHFVKTKVAYWSEKSMTRNAIESDFRSSKMVAGSHFVNKIKNWALIWNGEKCDWSSKMGGGASQWPACKPFGDIHSICPWENTPILVQIWSWSANFMQNYAMHKLIYLFFYKITAIGHFDLPIVIKTMELFHPVS